MDKQLDNRNKINFWSWRIPLRWAYKDKNIF